MPLRTELEQRPSALTRGRAAAEVLAMQFAADMRRAWYAAVVTLESATYAEKVKQIAKAGEELTRTDPSQPNIDSDQRTGNLL